MRDLNLGPDTRKLLEEFSKLSDEPTPRYDKLAILEVKMARMLERWLEVGWCWTDASPAQVCGGPHVRVEYKTNRPAQIIEPLSKVGETFPDVPHTIIKS